MADTQPRRGGLKHAKEVQKKRSEDSYIKRVEKKSRDEEEELDMFDYNPEKKNAGKFNSAKKKLIAFLGKRYPYIDHIIQYTEEYDFKNPEAPTDDEVDEANDPLRTRLISYQEELKLVIKDRSKYKADKRMAYTHVWNLCTQPLKNALKATEDYDDMEANHDLLALWTQITIVCLSGIDTNENPEIRKLDAMDRWIKIKQYATEDLGDFLERFNNELEVYEDAGNIVLEESMKAVEFIRKLDDHRFKALRAELRNSLGHGKDLYPKDLNTAYNLALTYRDTDYKLVAYKPYVKGVPDAAAYAAKVEKKSIKSLKKALTQSEKIQKGEDEEDSVSSKQHTYFTRSQGSSSSHEKSTTPVDLSKVECYFCKEKGHYKSDCPTLKKAEKSLSKMKTKDKNKKELIDNVSVTFEDTGFPVIEDIIASTKVPQLGEFDILCDNGATVSIVKNKDLLRNIRFATKEIKIAGLSGKLTVNQVGNFPGIGEVYYHPDSLANIFCFYDLVHKNNGLYDKDTNEFHAYLNGIKIKFKSIGKLYIWNAEQYAQDYVMIQTVEDNEKQFSKREVIQAKLARDAHRKLGYPSIKDLVYSIRNGKILNLPITVRDVENAITIYGKDLATLKGKSTRQKEDRVKTDPVIVNIEKHLTMCVDIFNIGGILFLLSITRKLELYVVGHLKDKSSKTLMTALQVQINIYKSKGFIINMILSDNEAGFVSDKSYLEAQGISINFTSKNEHVPEVERAGRQLKERVRGIWNTLPYKLNQVMIVQLVYYCARTINMFGKTNSIGGESPRELFMGIKTDYNKECKLGFGDYVQVYNEDEVTNTMRERTCGAISLGPSGNIQGSYNFLSLVTWKVIRRRSWTVVPIPTEVINLINGKATGVMQVEDVLPLQLQPEDENEAFVQEPRIFREENQVVNVEGHADQEMQNFEEPDIEGGNTNENEQEDIQDQEVPNLEQIQEVMNRNEVQEINRYNLRERRGPFRDPDYVYNGIILTNLNITQAVKQFGEEAALAVMKEISQLHEKGVWKPLKYQDLTSEEKKKIIKSILFLKRKRDGTLKARLVADGRMQDRSTIPDISSPTVATESLFIIASINAKEKREVVTLDVEGAFLNGVMINYVIIELGGQMAAVLLFLYPERYKVYEVNGKIYLKLERALYGTIEAAKIWYDTLSTYLMKCGFQANPCDDCVFNAKKRGVQVTVVMHVDDLMVSSVNKENVQDVINDLEKAYNKVNVQRGKKFDYLGMIFEYNDEGYVTISMEDLVMEIINDLSLQPTSKATTPASANLYDVNQTSELLSPTMHALFHSVTMKLLYVAKRARPDVLTAVGFLTTRVQRSTMEDLKKLTRVGAYLNATRTLKLKLHVKDKIKVEVYIDASHGTHLDGKGQSGATLRIGEGSVSNISSKQKLVSKSSSETELIGLSDYISPAIGAKQFLECQGYDVGPVKVYQDNKSTILMASKGKPVSSRTRHIAIRYFFIKDRINLGDIEISYVGTEDMLADFFTKPLQGSLFVKMRNTIMNNT